MDKPLCAYHTGQAAEIEAAKQAGRLTPGEAGTEMGAIRRECTNER